MYLGFRQVQIFFFFHLYRRVRVSWLWLMSAMGNVYFQNLFDCFSKYITVYECIQKMGSATNTVC